MPHPCLPWSFGRHLQTNFHQFPKLLRSSFCHWCCRTWNQIVKSLQVACSYSIRHPYRQIARILPCRVFRKLLTCVVPRTASSAVALVTIFEKVAYCFFKSDQASFKGVDQIFDFLQLCLVFVQFWMQHLDQFLCKFVPFLKIIDNYF